MKMKGEKVSKALSLQKGLLFVTIVIWCLYEIRSVKGFVNNPKIITKDGNLIFESGFNRNITFRLTGNSRLNINDELDVMDLLFKTAKGRTPGADGSEWTPAEAISANKLNKDIESIRRLFVGRQGFLRQVRTLQNRTLTAMQLIRRNQLRWRRMQTQVQAINQKLLLDNCKSNPCQNGGTCITLFNSYMCNCNNYYEGPNCERDVNECALFEGTVDGCQNGGQCVNHPNGFSCLCAPGWHGTQCTTRANDCSKSSNYELCKFGTCVNTNDNFGYKCICDQGWKTNGLQPECATDVDECAAETTKCVTRCINLPGSFTCAPCEAGLTGNGLSCRDINECAVENGGCSMQPLVPCINTYGSFHCGECPLGWTGDGRTCTRSEDASGDLSCSKPNICHPQATCALVSNSVVCSCPAGMVGNGIGPDGCVRLNGTKCDTQPCLNGGTCRDQGTSFTCDCPEGYAAPLCLPSPCTSNPCRNGGRCSSNHTTSYTCHCAPGFNGRNCENRAGRCGGVLTGETGILKYPEGSLYEHNAQCAWAIRTNISLVINVTFTAFELQDSTECRFDWLQLNDGRTAASQLIGRFCGTQLPKGGNIITTTNYLYLWFRSDNSTAKAGFELQWNSIPPQCGGIVNVTSHGTIASPGSPGNYPKNRDCVWQLRAPNTKRIKLVFFSLQIEEHESCNYDFLEIRDDIANRLLEKYCTKSSPLPLVLPTSEASIHFHSDSVGADTGFQIYYSLEELIPGCGGTFTTKEGEISSPTFTGNEYMSCEYDIKLPPGQTLTIEFLKFVMGPDDCIKFYDISPSETEGILNSKFCGDFAGSPVVLHSLYNAMRIEYASNGGEFTLKYRADCSFTYESDQDTITSPNYPSLADSDELCTYKILTQPNAVISVSIRDFALRDSSLDASLDSNANITECADNYLIFNDGMDQELLGPYCNSNQPPNEFVTKTNMLILHLKTATGARGRGFKIDYKTVPIGNMDCGGIFTKSGQHIRLPTNSENQYEHSKTCTWVIMAPPHKGISLTWLSFDLESSIECSYDYVEIFEGIKNDEKQKSLGRYCDNNQPPALTSYSSILTIKFTSDATQASTGFEATFQFIEVSGYCGEIHSSTGTLTSPNYPLNYTNGFDCTWLITSPPGTQIELIVLSFELEKSEYCANDYLEIRNGRSNQSALIGKFCGTNIPQSIPSFTHQFYIHFHADNYDSARGFQLRWENFANGCGGNLYGESGVITSPNYPQPYPNDAICEWTVRVAEGSIIHFKIEDFELEELSQCSYDYLEVYDGRSLADILLAKMCRLNSEQSPEIITTGNNALLLLRTDQSNTERGFRISYKSYCTHTLTAVYGAIESPNYGDPYNRNDVNCSWTIRAPKGSQIAIELTHFDNYDGSDNIYFIEQNSNGTNTTKVIRNIQSFNSTGNQLTIVQNSSVVSFRLEYNMYGCIARFRKDSGEFKSPNHPKWYPNDIDCYWEIETAPGRAIELIIENMNIEESVNCTKDALIISSDLFSSNPKERHCGTHDKLTITSASHKLHIRFHSDDSHNGLGFEASYRIVKSSCGGVFKSKNGIIQSPNYPMNYPKDADCEWLIEVSEYHTITLTIEEFDLENGFSTECHYDYVTATQTDNGTDHDLFRLCGSNPSQTQWKTIGNKVTIHFKTDDSAEQKGFKIAYKENCGQRIMISNNDFNVIDVTKPSALNETCEWQLIAEDPAQHVALSISLLELSPIMALQYHTEAECQDIGGKVTEGDSSNGPLRAKFCKEHPPAIISHGHALTISLPTSVIAVFMAEYSLMQQLCGGFLMGRQGKFSTPYYPSSYPLNILCQWLLVAYDGNAVVLTFESMDLEESEDCNNDFLEVRESDERGKLLGVFCGGTVPAPIRSNVTIWMRFSSNNDAVGTGFMASYNNDLHNDISGRNGTVMSPAYPSPFATKQPYSYRIEVEKEYVVLLNIQHIVDTNMPYIKFYDGYSEIGALIDYSMSHIVRSSTNVLYFTAERGPFLFEWERLSKEALQTDRAAEEQLKLCGTQMIAVDTPIQFSSPGYPNGYANSLNCSWKIVAANQAMHPVLTLNKIDLEEMDNCFADYVRVSNSADLENWQELDKLCKKPETTIKTYEGKPYLKLDFVTDVGINKTGFSASVKAVCGARLTDKRGYVNITAIQRQPLFVGDCVWTIQVRQGRRIRITFPESIFSKPSPTNNCRSYFLVRNGIAEDSPFLGKGKYCDNNITDVLETTANHAFIRFHQFGFYDTKASFAYEEISHQCSGDIQLTEGRFGNSSYIISSPNYPNIPHPHTECIWMVHAPPHHAIAVDFLEKFDLADACEREYVQLNDGGSELMPLLGRYCGTRKPSTIYTTGNLLRLKYFTEISEPHTGFKAQISLARCGGSYYEDSGIIESPAKSIAPFNEPYTECVYTLEMKDGSTIRIDFEEFNLPQTDICNNQTHIELREIEMIDGVDNITDTLTICKSSGYASSFDVETNKLTVIYRLMAADRLTASFKMRYRAVGERCGETIIASRGTLMTPGYPSGVKRPIRCTWRLQVPKNRRIKLEILDYDVGGQNDLLATETVIPTIFYRRMLFANDFSMLSHILRVTNNPPSVVYSTDNTMGIDVILTAMGKHRGIKMRFSSNEPASKCINYLDLLHGGVLSFKRANTTSLYCSYDLNVPQNTTLVLRVQKYSITYPDRARELCMIAAPMKLVQNNRILSADLLCRNETTPYIRLPFDTTLTLSANNRNGAQDIEIEYKLYTCGGILKVLDENTTITQPQIDNLNGRLECAWLITSTDDTETESSEDTQYEVQLVTDFKDNCENQYLLVYNGPNQNSPHLARYCGQNKNITVVFSSAFFFEYFTNSYETQSTFNMSVRQGSGCGGRITYPYRKIYFAEQYQNNVECIWELETSPGFCLELSFEGRFFIESSAGCKKDYLRVQQKNASGAWEDLQTICGRDPPKSINSTNTDMRVIFRSDADTTADGFTMVFRRYCGGILYATDDIKQIASPGYPVQYESNLYCNYTIVPADQTSSGVLVRFVDFEMEEAPTLRCLFDNVTITTVDQYDSKDAVLCGRNKFAEYRATKYISVILHTDQSINSKGFLFEYTARLCGGLITNATIITSPRQHTDSSFPPNSICMWNITAPEGHKILIKFEELDYENQMICSYDGVEVYKGHLPVNDQRMAKFCGNLTGHLPPILSVPQNTAMIRSFSDERDVSRGFRAIVTFQPNCDRQIFLGPQNDTFNFNQYAGNYANDLDCSFVFMTSPDRQLLLEFTSLHLEDSIGCTDDFVQLRDGAGAFADEIGKYCGHEVPSQVMSSRNRLFLRFVSDSDENSAGFGAIIKTTPRICGEQNLVLEDKREVVIKSPSDTDGKYLKNLNCFWKITSDRNIHVKFNKMDLEETPNCASDSLKIYGSEDATIVEQGYGNRIIYNGKSAMEDFSNFALEYIFCGNRTPDAYYSTSKEVYVKFTTDSKNEGKGFMLTATRIEGCYRNFTGKHGRLVVAEATDHCDIYIKAPNDTYTISLYYMDTVLNENDCNLEYVEVFDGHTNTSLQKLCTYVEPGRSLFSNTSMLRMRIKLSTYYARFDITYAASTHGPGCGTDFYNSQGLFTSPYYPNHVRENSDCRWSVKVPGNLHVLLRFESFNLGAKSTCHSDYLQIIELDSDGNEVVQRQFCGEDDPKVYKSTKSFVIVRYKKTVNHDGTGWAIRFNGVYSNYVIPSYYLA